MRSKDDSPTSYPYLMENPEEAERLEMKTDLDKTRRQLLWAGLKQEMRALDLGCGSGIVSNLIAELVGESGHVLGVDGSKERVDFAQRRYGERETLGFSVCLFEDLGKLDDGFDFIWSRFVFEYLADPEPVLEQALEVLNPGGVLCVIDLDYNAITHYPLPPLLEQTLAKIAAKLGSTGFDPYVGRKLYKLFYDHGLHDIEVDIEAHHCIYGPLNDVDRFNWLKKAEVISKLVPKIHPDYPEGGEGFVRDFMQFFERPDRFTYTPMIKVKGTKP
jgi:ubiquinone/menaquinone biosynthesis C-methylase UbiE